MAAPPASTATAMVVARLCGAVSAGLRDLAGDSMMLSVTTTADRVAQQVLAGGRLYAAGAVDFVSEAVVRGGGLMLVEPWTAAARVSCTPADIVLVGWTGEESAEELGALLQSSPTSRGVPSFHR